MGAPTGIEQGQDECRLLLHSTMSPGSERLCAIREQRLPSDGTGRRLRNLERARTGHRGILNQSAQERRSNDRAAVLNQHSSDWRPRAPVTFSMGAELIG